MVRRPRNGIDIGLVCTNGPFPFNNAIARLWPNLKVISSIIAAWSDITHTFYTYGSSQPSDSTVFSSTTVSAATVVGQLNAGYVWMLMNCLVTAGYVRDTACPDAVFIIHICYPHRSWLCANASKLPDSKIGTPCSITIYSRYQCSLSSQSLLRTGVQKAWHKICILGFSISPRYGTDD